MRIQLIVLFASLAAQAAVIRVGTVCAGGCNYSNSQLQNAIDAANPGDNIVLSAGESFPIATLYMLRNKGTSTSYINIQSSALASLPWGQRVDPSQTALMPLVCTTSGGPGANSTNVIGTDVGAHHWRLMGLNISMCAAGQNHTNDLIWLSSRDNIAPQPVERTPHHIVIDRCWIHGYVYDQGPQRGINSSSNDVIFTNNYIDEIHESSGNEESHAIAIGKAGRNVLIRNNRISSSSEGSFTGGGRDDVSNQQPANIRVLGNQYTKRGGWITYNYYHDPEGTTIPPVAAALSGQQWTDTTNRALHYMKSSSSWRRLYMPLGANEPRCFPDALWRNQSTQPPVVWKCNADGTRWVAGAADVFASWYNATPTAVTTGTTTTFTCSGAGCPNLFPGMGWRQNSNIYPIAAKFAGGTGAWAALNGQQIVFSPVGTGSPFTQITIPFDSTGFGTGWQTLVMTPQFIMWTQKNGGEFKSGAGLHFEGNIIENTWPFTSLSQRGFGYLMNWVPSQDGPNMPLTDMYWGNNLIRNVVTGFSGASVQWEFNSTSITTGATTLISNLGSFFGRIGERYYVSGGTGPWPADLTPWQVVDTGTFQGGTLAGGQVRFNYNSTGHSTAGVTLRLRDDNKDKPSVWPYGWRIDNNIFEVATVASILGYGGNTVTASDNGTVGHSLLIGQSFQVGFDSEITRNTFIRRGQGPGSEWAIGAFFEADRQAIHKKFGAADANIPSRFRFHDNIDDGDAGRWTNSNNVSQGCASAINLYWTPNGGYVEMSGNVASYGDERNTYATFVTVNNAEYGSAVCPGWTRVYGRQSPSFPVQDTDGSVTVSANAGTFTFASAPRLISGSKFCVTASTPNNLIGCYTLPAAVDSGSTTWTAVPLPGVPNNTYTGVVIDSAINFVDPANRNYRLASGSMFKGQGRNGADPGADQNVVEWATETVVSGLHNPYLDTYIISIDPTDTTAVICYDAYDITGGTLTVATSRSYTPNVGSSTVTSSTDRRQCRTVTGLTANTRYWVRLNVTGGRYRDQFPNGKIAEFTTKQFAVLEADYLTWVDTGAPALKAAYVGTSIQFGCFLVIAGANGYVADFPAIYENLTAWKDAADNLKAAGCSRIVINVDMTPWIANDTTDIQRYKDIFQYIVTDLGLQLEISPPGSGLARAACLTLPACPNGGAPCYDGSFTDPNDWHQCAKAAMAAMAQLPANQRPVQINVIHEPTSSNSELSISGGAAAWAAVVTAFATNATYGIKTINPAIVSSAGCHIGEYLYCQQFSDLAGLDRIGINVFDHMNLNALGAMITDALAADGTPKDVYILASSPPFYTNDYTQNEVNAIHGVGWPRPYTPVCYACQWMDGFIRRVSSLGVTGLNVFWTQPFRYYAQEGEEDKGLSSVYNGNVQNTPDTTLTNYGQFFLNHPLLN